MKENPYIKRFAALVAKESSTEYLYPYAIGVIGAIVESGGLQKSPSKQIKDIQAVFEALKAAENGELNVQA